MTVTWGLRVPGALRRAAAPDSTGGSAPGRILADPGGGRGAWARLGAAPGARATRPVAAGAGVRAELSRATWACRRVRQGRGRGHRAGRARVLVHRGRDRDRAAAAG